MAVIRKAASDYTREIFHKLREREYNPELMRLYVVVGGGCCMIQNFGEYDKDRVTIVRDIFDFATQIFYQNIIDASETSWYFIFDEKWELFKGKLAERQGRKARRG